MSNVRTRLAPEFRDLYDQLIGMPMSATRTELIETLLCRADPARARLPLAYRGEYEKIMAMEPSPVRDGLMTTLARMAGGEHDYFDWNGVPVRVACAGGASQAFRDGAWQAGGPSYAIRQDECDALDRKAFAARFPDAASAR